MSEYITDPKRLEAIKQKIAEEILQLLIEVRKKQREIEDINRTGAYIKA